MSLRDDVLPILQDVRGLLDDLGFRRYDLLMRTVVWSGERPGDGTATVTDTPITLDGSHRIKVKEVSAHDIMPGGLYQEGDYLVGPFTPAYSGGGVATTYFDPVMDPDVPQEIFFKMTGPGFESGKWLKKIDTSTWKNFGYFFTLRITNTVPEEP